MSTLVVHVNDPEGFDLYVGRAARRARNQRAKTDSPWRNPFGFDSSDPVARQESLRRFEDFLFSDDPDADWMRSNLHLIRGKRLACWCAPVGQALTADDRRVCHGQILAELADRDAPELARDEFAAAVGLDPAEADAWDKVCEAARAYLALPSVHPMERAEVCTAFHDVQARLLSRPALRLLASDAG